MPQRWKHVLSRELDLLAAARNRFVRLLGGWWPVTRTRRRPPMAAQYKGRRYKGQRQQGLGPMRRRRPVRGPPGSIVSRTRRYLPGRVNTAAFLSSAVLHVIVFGWLLSIALPRPNKTAVREEFVLEVRLRLPPVESPRPAVPPPEPELETSPAMEVEGLTVESEEKERVDASPADVAPASEGVGQEALPEASVPRALKWVGLGGPPSLDPTEGVARLGNRSSGKAAALERYGGSIATENAVDKGLRWLAAHQDSNGSWDADGYTRRCRPHAHCAGTGLSEYDVGITGLSLLAFLGAGYGPAKNNPYRRHVNKGLSFLISRQDGAGAFGSEGSGYFYNHAIATFALSEAYAMTGRKDFRECVEAALRYSRASQQAAGGWDYGAETTGRNDLSISGWQIMAMRSAENAGLLLPGGMTEGTVRFLRSAFTPKGHGIYANSGLEAGRRGINMTAVGLLSYLYLGGLPTAEACRLAADRMLTKRAPDYRSTARWKETFQSYYYWYSASLGLFHLGGKRWEGWNYLLKKTLLPLQEKDGHVQGSWPPERSWIGQSGGRVYSTAINTLTLEVYYRYQPLYGAR